MQHNIFESHSGWLKFGSNQVMVNEVNLSRYCFAENAFNWPVSTIYVITLKCKSYSGWLYVYVIPMKFHYRKYMLEKYWSFGTIPVPKGNGK